MTWQEELRRLDAALAAGSLAVEDHRRQREEILAEASSAPALSPSGVRRTNGGEAMATGTPPAPTTETAPAQAQPVETAPEPPVVTEQAAPEQPTAPPATAESREPTRSTEPTEPTEPAAPAEPERPARPPAKTAGAASLLFTERPTTAPSPADKNATDAMPYPRRSAPVPRSVELTMPLGRIPASPTGDPAPPPLPIPPAGGTPKATKDKKTKKAKKAKKAKVKQTDAANDLGYTEPPEDRGRTGTWLLISLGVLIALGAVVGGAWWLGNGNTTTSDQSAVAAQRGQNVSLENKLPRLPGTPNPQNSTMSVDRGAELGLYTANDAKAMHGNGADEVIYRASAEGKALTDGYTVIVIPTSSNAGAKDLSEQLSDTIRTQGFSRESLGDAPYTALSRADTAARVSVVWYSSGDTTVGVGVSQAASSAQDHLRERLIRTLTSVDKVLPRG